MPKRLNNKFPPLSQDKAKIVPVDNDNIWGIISALSIFAPDERYAKVEKQPINAPGINQNGFATDFKHIVHEIIPVIIIAVAGVGILLDINRATAAENTPDIVEKNAAEIPSKPCLPDAK